jgi:EmrB/QacA subfamily drug resistance transporter
MLGRLNDPVVAHRRRWFTLLVLCLSLMVIGIDNTILNVAIPTLAKPTSAGGLGASASELQWIVDAYTIVFAGLLLTSGSLGDRFGRYRALTVGLVIFGIGSALSAFAPSATVLIGTRAVMGIGASAIMPATLSILTNVFHDPRERAKAIGVWAGVSAIGIAVGPILGGVLLQHFWWGSVFLVNVPVVGFALVAGFLLVPDSRDPDAGKLDPLGSVLSIAGLSVLLWAVIEGPSQGWGSPQVLTGFVVGTMVLVGFFVWELRSANPMLDVRFFENPRFSAASGAITLAFLALFGTIFLLTQYTQQVLGYSTVAAGAVFLPQSIVLMIFAPMSTRWVRIFGNKAVVATGCFILAVSLVLMTTFQTDSSIVLVMAITALSAFGMAHVVAPSTDSIMGSLPRAKAGVGSAMNDTTRQVGGAVGVALLGSILASAFRPHVRDLLRGHVPGSFLGRVEDSVGSALGVARDVPGARPYATRIVSAAQTSFVNGMHAAVLVAAAIAVLGGIGVLIWLPARARAHPDDVDVIEPALDAVAADEVTASATPAAG